jgi:hypothetical protein
MKDGDLVDFGPVLLGGDFDGLDDDLLGGELVLISTAVVLQQRKDNFYFIVKAHHILEQINVTRSPPHLSKHHLHIFSKNLRGSVKGFNLVVAAHAQGRPGSPPGAARVHTRGGQVPHQGRPGSPPGAARVQRVKSTIFSALSSASPYDPQPLQPLS